MMGVTWPFRWPNQKTRPESATAFSFTIFKRLRNRNRDSMKFLGFYPETVAARVRAAAAPPRLLTLGQSIGFGAGGFCLVIVIVMGLAAVTDDLLKKHLSDKGAYALDVLLLILMAGGVFRRLIIAPAPVFRVYVLFAAAFFLYDAAWTAAFR